MLGFLANAAIMYFIFDSIVGKIDDFRPFMLKFLIISFAGFVASIFLSRIVGPLAGFASIAIYVLGFTLFLQIDIKQSLQCVGLYFLVMIFIQFVGSFITVFFAYILVFVIYVIWATVTKKGFGSI